ncbi:hypothetical protein L484_024402 [Morus notabilis]|uniref:Uncharacterized protein n=1 Tax=Morus notabilis TaxID=981085 RepID=W9RX22_9ROSA|nr:uncharacterized protein LOC21407143 isoform X1 [Morus notabilis]EXC16230.1 hypothetical protein L484_024402 [Morus notabilis]
MDSKTPKFQILHGSVARRVLIRTFLIAAALSVIPLVHILSGPYLKMLAPIMSGDCAVHLGQSTTNFTPSWYVFQGRHLNPIWSSIEPMQCKEYVNLTTDVVRELMGKQFLNPAGAKALCIGEGSAVAAKALRDLGFSEAYDVDEQRFFSFRRRQFVYEIDYEEKSFDFVFSRDLDMVSAPALLVLEIERVLSPGGIGAVLLGTSGSTPNSLIRSATPISSVLKTSGIVHVNHINNLTLVAFRKRIENTGYFEQYRLPADCPSLTTNRPFIEHMEPLVEDQPKDFEKSFSYLPKFVDASSKKRLVYVDIGAGKHLNPNVTNWFLPSYPIDSKAFNVYFVDHNTSVLLSYVKKPGITFVYHPGLSATEANVSTDGDLEPYLGNTGFDFLAWFKETVQYADFVVLKMNAGTVEMKFLSELFESGAICYVDELFLHCSGYVDGEGATLVKCTDMLKDLRHSGVFVHQWWGDYNPSGAW